MTVKRKTFEDLASTFFDDTFADFKKTVQINDLITVDDGQGGRTATYQAFGSPVDAFIFPLGGSENVSAGRYYTDQDFKFMFKPVAGLNTKMQLVSDSVTYGITSINDVALANVWTIVIAQKNPSS